MQKLVNGKLIDMTQAEIDARNVEIAVYETEQLATEYQRLRKAEYPPLEEQLDAIFKGGVELEDMKTKILAVKNKYPKVK